MFNINASKTTGQILGYGVPAVSLFLMISNVTDPVNPTKLFVLGIVGFSSLFVLLKFQAKYLWANRRKEVVILILFILSMVNALLNSVAPFEQNFYGIKGRNTGLLTYFLLGCILLAASTLCDRKAQARIIMGLYATGAINLLYCAWVLVFGDFLGWSNPYGNILGLFGNPDFISAFLGIFFTSLVARLFSPKLGLIKRILLAFLALAALIEIKLSHAIQGLVVAACGLVIVLFFLIRSLSKSKWLEFSYILLALILGTFAIFGALQHGPFSFLYKRSVSFRGSYWKAGIRMGSDHLLTGVGMDSYGDWYRRERPAIALVDTPGIKTMSNVAHNVVIDFFAHGGLPLLLSYLSIIFVTILYIFRVMRVEKSYDWLFVSIVSGWVTYQLQSLISINQIGLTIWGWVFSGLIVAYASNKASKESDKSQKRASVNSEAITPGLVAFFGVIIGVIIGIPPLSADMKWRNALASSDVVVAEKALARSYLTPGDSQRFAEAVDLMARSGLNDQALKYAKIAVEFNPDFFDSWMLLYNLPNVSVREKELALANMLRLDPKNPNVLLN